MLMNLPANEENATERQRGTRKGTGEEMNRQEREEGCKREKIWLVETLQLFLNVGFNIGFY